MKDINQRDIYEGLFPTDAFSYSQPGTASPTLGMKSGWTMSAPTVSATTINATTFPLGKGYLFGLTLSNGTDATNDIDIAAGTATDNDDGTAMALTAITKQLDAGWAVGTNAGGLDTGAIANTTYHVWVIKNPTSGVVDALFSASATAPTMPSGYTKKRRIGAIIRSGGAILGFGQMGDRFYWTGASSRGFLDVNAARIAAATVYALTVPPNMIAIVMKLMAGVSTAASAADYVEGWVAGAWRPAGESQAGLAAVTERDSGTYMEVPVNGSSQIRMTASAANGSWQVRTEGWIDTRGRDA